MLSQPAPAKKNICAVVVSHRPDEEFLLNIKSVVPQVDKVVVVNNGSKKLTSDFFKKAGLGEKVHLISNSENLGQGKALNQGADQASFQGYEWVLLLDQDNLLAPSMVENSIYAWQACPFREKVKAIGPNCIFKDIEETQYQKECKDKLYFERDVIMMGNLLSLSAFKEVGPFREEFFIDSTDADYCLRLRKKGYRLIIACKAQMELSVGTEATMRRFFGKKFLVTNHSPERCYYMIRNGLILVKEYAFREPYWVLRRIIWYLFVKPGLVILYEKNKFQKLKSMLVGAIHALIGKL